jgi:F0F1-type ATP synthase membrane subunit b/b'
MESFNYYLPVIFGVLIVAAFWYVIRKIFKAISNRINNADLYKEDLLNVLEEIRDELKELNKKNSDR